MAGLLGLLRSQSFQDDSGNLTLAASTYISLACGVAGVAFVIVALVFGPNGSIFAQLGSAGFYGAIIVGALLYLGHVGSALFTETWEYLGTVLNETQIVEYITKMKGTVPQLGFYIRCYHTHTQSTGQGGSTKTTVVTHEAEMNYQINVYRDETLTLPQIQAMLSERAAGGPAAPSTMLLLCGFPLTFEPVNEMVEEHMIASKTSFFVQNRKDENQDEETNTKLDGWKERIMVVLHPGKDSQGLPFWMNKWFFFVCCFLLLSVPYRLYFIRQCHGVKWEILKHYSPSDTSGWWQDPPVKSRLLRDDEASLSYKKTQPPPEPPTIVQQSAGMQPGMRQPNHQIEMSSFPPQTAAPLMTAP